MTTSDSILTGERISVLCASAVWEERRTSRSSFLSASSGITSMATCIERSLSKGAPPRWNGEEDIAATFDATTMVATDAAATSTIIDVTIAEEDDGPTPPRRPSAMDRRGAATATGNNAAATACATRLGGSDSRIH